MKFVGLFHASVRTVIVSLLFVLVVQTGTAAAEAYSYDGGKTVIGIGKRYKVGRRESLIEIARKFDLGYNEITEANPGLDPFVPGTGAALLIPSSWILPDVESYKGIVINLSEFRMYYFFNLKRERYVMTFPLGIGSEGNDTPVGEFSVIQKIVNPAWHVPESIRREKPELPAVVPPGPDNPLGAYALRLSLGSILIHGTNRPFAVGRKASHGCLRLYPEDIPRLFTSVSKGVKVTIVRQPIKVGVKGDKVYIEVHNDGSLDSAAAGRKGYFDEAVGLLARKGLLSRVDTRKLYSALNKKLGIPTDISE